MKNLETIQQAIDIVKGVRVLFNGVNNVLWEKFNRVVISLEATYKAEMDSMFADN